MAVTTINEVLLKGLEYVILYVCKYQIIYFLPNVGNVLFSIQMVNPSFPKHWKEIILSMLAIPVTRTLINGLSRELSNKLIEFVGGRFVYLISIINLHRMYKKVYPELKDEVLFQNIKEDKFSSFTLKEAVPVETGENFI